MYDNGPQNHSYDTVKEAQLQDQKRISVTEDAKLKTHQIGSYLHRFYWE
jgi:hypothetical protein